MATVPNSSLYLKDLAGIEKIACVIDSVSKETLFCCVVVGSTVFQDIGSRNKEVVLSYLKECVDKNYVPWVSVYSVAR